MIKFFNVKLFNSNPKKYFLYYFIYWITMYITLAIMIKFNIE